MKTILLILCFLASPCFAQQISKEDRAAAVKIDRVVNEQMSANKIPGVSLAVLRKGKIVLLKSYGLANVEHQVPVKPETIFQSGSMGKQFTAAGIMILAQENNSRSTIMSQNIFLTFRRPGKTSPSTIC